MSKQSKQTEGGVVCGCGQESTHKASFIGDYHAAPHFMKDNAQIHNGYRINFNSVRQLFKSLFMLHNESVNIWSHLLTFIVFVFLGVSLFMVIDDHKLAKTLNDYRHDIQLTFKEYQASHKNLTIRQSLDSYSDQAKAEMKIIKAKVLEKYNQIIHKIDKKSTQINALLDQNIQGIKDNFKQQLKEGLLKIQKYKRNFQQNIAPEIVQKVQHSLNSDLLQKVKFEVDSLKDHLDSALFQPMQLHPQAPNPMFVSRWPLFVFLSSAIACLLFSTIFHLFHPLSSKTYGLLLRFDFAGISLLIAGSIYPPLYYGMYCHFAVAEIYLTCSVVAAVLCFFISLFEWIHKKGNEKYRSMVFGTFGMLMFIPLTHLAINQFLFDNYGDSFRFSSSYIYYVLLASSYCTGLYIFSVRCPERNNPGKYDICGHSHQIWHFLVVLGVVATYLGALENFQMRKQSACPA